MEDNKIVCFQCKEEITPENDGMIINEGEPTQMAQCDDCHYIEYGVHVWPDLLRFYKEPKQR